MRRAPFVASVAFVAGVTLAACSSGSPTTSLPSPPSAVPTSGAPSSAPVSSVPATPSPTRTLLSGPPRLALVARFASPTYVTAPPGDPRLFVVEQAGRIRVVRDGRTLPAPYLDITRAVGSGGERGLLSMAFAPDYAKSGRFYVDYTDTDGDTRVVEYTVSSTDPDRADAGSRRELLKVAQPFANHNGGLLLFDPSGRLLVGLGDGGSHGDPDNRAQNLGELLGKVLRIDPRPSGGRPYGIPPDNPYAGRSGVRPEIWAYGLRNPWRFSFDLDGGGVLYLADVGQNAVEEVNAVPPAAQPGANYGWRVFEGRERYTAGSLAGPGRQVVPVHTYDHGRGRCSVTGGVVYRGSVRALRGRYLFGDYCSGELWSFAAGTRDRPAVSRLPFGGGHPVSFGVDAAGEVYLASADGEVWKITA
jgi:glucose/arabinose dehydrogenase